MDNLELWQKLGAVGVLAVVVLKLVLYIRGIWKERLTTCQNILATREKEIAGLQKEIRELYDRLNACGRE